MKLAVSMVATDGASRPRGAAPARRSTRAACLAALMLVLATAVPQPGLGQAPRSPAHDAPTLTEPPPLPPLGDFSERAKLLLEAIVKGDPACARVLFLPRDAFARIKAVDAPDPVYERLLRAYERDIHTLHKTLVGLPRAEFLRVELSRRRSYVRPGEEANRLPYWAQRHAWLVYRLGGRAERLELRVMIAWDNRWYLTHLSEFHH